MLKYTALVVALFVSTIAAKDFLCVKMDCGAIPKTSLKVDLNTTIHNAKALETCLQRANQKGQPKVVKVPGTYAFSSMATLHQNLSDVTLQIDGVWEASPFYKEWPLYPDSNDALDFLTFEDSENLIIKGEGIVDGLGYDWWVREWEKKNIHGRPHLLKYQRVQTSDISGVKWLNSPMYNLMLGDIDSVNVHDLEIRTDILKQKAWVSEEHQLHTFDDHVRDFCYQFMLHFFSEYRDLVELLFSGKTDWTSAPTMPLNTDGIDPSGSNVTIRNVKITNWDDAVAVKPGHSNNKVAKDGCAQDILVENMTVVFGVGATIGSVPPSSHHACIRRVHFKDVNFDYPMKAIYVKTNPGDGTGEIKDIFYENIKIYFPIWFGIYIGPQQQEQPDGGGPGCMTYPFEKCETQPKIDVQNITLLNVTSESGVMPPGIIRCNATNPCKDINLIDVNIRGWWESMNWTFISEYVDGKVSNTYPDPHYGNNNRVFDMYSLENVLSFMDQLTGFYKVNQRDILGWETLFGIILWALNMALDGGHF